MNTQPFICPRKQSERRREREKAWVWSIDKLNWRDSSNDYEEMLMTIPIPELTSFRASSSFMPCWPTDPIQVHNHKKGPNQIEQEHQDQNQTLHSTSFKPALEPVWESIAKLLRKTMYWIYFRRLCFPWLWTPHSDSLRCHDFYFFSPYLCLRHKVTERKAPFSPDVHCLAMSIQCS